MLTERLTSLAHPSVSRRDMLTKCSTGFGLLALSGLLAERAGADGAGQASPFAPRQPHFKPKVKSVIFCFMSGGVSHVA